MSTLQWLARSPGRVVTAPAGDVWSTDRERRRCRRSNFQVRRCEPATPQNSTCFDSLWTRWTTSRTTSERAFAVADRNHPYIDTTKLYSLSQILRDLNFAEIYVAYIHACIYFSYNARCLNRTKSSLLFAQQLRNKHLLAVYRNRWAGQQTSNIIANMLYSAPWQASSLCGSVAQFDIEHGDTFTHFTDVSAPLQCTCLYFAVSGVWARIVVIMQIAVRPWHQRPCDPVPCDFSCVRACRWRSDVCSDYYWQCAGRRFTMQRGPVRKPLGGRLMRSSRDPRSWTPDDDRPPTVKLPEAS